MFAWRPYDHDAVKSQEPELIIVYLTHWKRIMGSWTCMISSEASPAEVTQVSRRALKKKSRYFWKTLISELLERQLFSRKQLVKDLKMVLWQFFLLNCRVRSRVSYRVGRQLFELHARYCSDLLPTEEQG